MLKMPGDQDTAEDKIDAVKFVYGITIGDIREFKARQWDVTKWPITVILALIVPLFLAETNPPEEILVTFFVIGLALGLWSVCIIVRLQFSLRYNRRRLDGFKTQWPAIKETYGATKKYHLSVWYNCEVWLFQIGLIVVSMGILSLAYQQALGWRLPYVLG